MNHADIERDNLIDRYVRATLHAAEWSAFEEHFVDCQECLDQLAAARSLREAICYIAAEDALSARTVNAAPRRHRAWQWVVAPTMAALAIAAVAGPGLVRQLQRTRTELADARLTFQRQLESAREELDPPPLAFVLEPNRGVVGEKTITIPRGKRWIVFSAEIDTTQFGSCRVALFDNNGKEIWHEDDVRPASPDALAVSVPSSVLGPGGFVLAIETSGRLTLARFTLRVELR